MRFWNYDLATFLKLMGGVCGWWKQQCGAGHQTASLMWLKILSAALRAWARRWTKWVGQLRSTCWGYLSVLQPVAVRRSDAFNRRRFDAQNSNSKHLVLIISTRWQVADLEIRMWTERKTPFELLQEITVVIITYFDVNTYVSIIFRKYLV